MAVISITGENALQMALSQDDYLMQATPAYGADDPFDIGILPT